jgi:tRNA (guanosine-2'-O-)-methyltransferase
MHPDERLIAFLETFITPERLQRFDEVLSNRTNYITIVLEDIFQSHNISAILRSCDCFGINHVHLVENSNDFAYNDLIGMGSIKWLNLTRHNKLQENTLPTIEKLKATGYRIIATTPHHEGYSPENLNLEAGPVALLFGTEYTGLSEKVFDHCDGFLKIPLYGFTESLNVSVSAAVILQNLYNRLIVSGLPWHLDENEKNKNKLKWLKSTIKKSELLEKEFYKKK